MAALLREREHYVRRGLPDRVAQVDAELDRLGYRDQETAATAPPSPPVADEPETTALQPAPETTTPSRPQPKTKEPRNAKER